MKRLKEISRLDFLLTNNFKSNCTFLLSLIAIAMFLINPVREQKICMYAILVSTLADLVLMNYNNIPGLILKKSRFYVGMAMFAVTHILYSVCFYNCLGTFILKDTFVSAILFVAIHILLFMFMDIYAAARGRIFLLATILYRLIISIAVFYIYACAEIHGGKYFITAAGITLFFVSDILIFIRETQRDTKLIRKLIWIFYPIGQLLIISSVFI